MGSGPRRGDLRESLQEAAKTGTSISVHARIAPERLAIRSQFGERSFGELDAFVSGTAAIEGIAVEIGTFQFAFMGGSMGSVVGELITRQIERAVALGQPWQEPCMASSTVPSR